MPRPLGNRDARYRVQRPTGKRLTGFTSLLCLGQTHWFGWPLS